MSLIVLHTTRYSENSLILHAYTQEGGRESFIIRGAYGSRKKSTHCLYHLNILEYETAKGGKGSLKVLKEYNSKEKLEEIRTRIDKSSIAMFICELIYRGIRENCQDEELYMFLHKSIITLNDFPSSCANFHIWFLVRLCEVMGLSTKGNFAYDYNPFSSSQTELIRILDRDSFADVYDVRLNRDERRKLIDSLLKYLEFHLGIHLEMRSLDILHSIFSV